MFRSPAVLSVLALAPLSAQAQPVAWNATNEFSIDHGNPNGVWSYGWMPVGLGTLTLYQNSGVFGPGDSPQWYGWGGDHTPGIWKSNRTDTAWGVAPGQMSLHPGPGTEPCVVRWVAPAAVAGSVHVVGAFHHGDIGWVRCGILDKGAIAWEAGNNGSFDLSLTVNPGDAIDFFVDQGYGYGNTPLDVTITFGTICPADLDNGTMTGTTDGAVTIDDLLYFLAVYEAGSVAADLDDGSMTGVHDGAVTIDDLLFFLVHYEGGC